MGRETKIGMVVIALLLCVLGGVIFKRMSGGTKLVGLDGKGKDITKQTDANAKESTTQSQTTNKPTLLTANSSTSRPPSTTAKSASSDRWSSASSRRRGSSTDTSTSYRSKSAPGNSGGRYGSTSRSYSSNYQRSAQSGRQTTADSNAQYSPYRRQFNASDSLAAQEPPRPLMTPGGQDYSNPATVTVAQGPALSQPGTDTRGNPLRGQSSGGQSYNPYQRSSDAATQSYSPYRQSADQSLPARPVSQGVASTSNVRFAPSPSIAPEPLVEMRENTGKYYVEPGDSYWVISQKMYGEGGFFKALEAHNRGRIPNASRLQVGDEIETPDISTLRQKYAGICPKQRVAKRGTPRATNVSTSLVRSGRTYVVEEGDTLFDIARYELGDPQRWPEIYQLNRQALGEDIDFVRPGTSLILPAKPGAEPPIQQRQDVLTRQPGQRVYR